MKKTFQLNVENKNKDRLVEAIKHEIRKYIKREKNKPLPDKVDFWNFNCKFGKNEDVSEIIEFVDITKNIDFASSENWDNFYLEIISTQGFKPVKVIEEEKTIEENIEE